MHPLEFTVSEFIDVCNQTLEYSYANMVVVGEVSGFKVNQGKWVFFDLKDEEGSLGCFMTLWDLRQPLEDGMKVRVRGVPKLTKWGKFSFTVQQIMPVGEGNIKKSFELLKKKLSGEGLFDPAKKRPLPENIGRIGVISSTQAAGYADFIKIVNERWGGLKIDVCHTQVQGLVAADQIIRALDYLNQRSEVDVIAIIRGGGSADDLAVFNDEQLVRAIAASKIPVITGIGHEVDESLSDLAGDVVASTPSNAAQMLTPDRAAIKASITDKIERLSSHIDSKIDADFHNIESVIRGVRTQIVPAIENAEDYVSSAISGIRKSRVLGEIDHYLLALDSHLSGTSRSIHSKIDGQILSVDSNLRILDSVNPDLVLAKGYAIIRGEVDVGQTIELETLKQSITANVLNIKERNKS